MAAIRDYTQLAKDILSEVGGQENVSQFSRCATRLRLILNEVPEGAADNIKQMPGVITVVLSGGQFQVVIGTHVSDVYEAMSQLLDSSLLSDKQHKMSVIDSVIAAMSAIFAPIIFILAAAGILQGSLIFARFLAPSIEATGTFEVLNFMSWTPFAFLPVFIAITSAKHFNCNPFIAVLCACALINPSWAEMASRIAGGEVITFLSLPLAKTVYTSSVLPPIFMVWALSYVERFVKRVIPGVVSELFTPLICMLIMVPTTLVVIGPVMSFVASSIAGGYNSLFDAAPVLAAALIGGIWQIIVIFGVHWGITPVVFANYENFGYDTFQAFQAIAVVAQMAAALAVAFKSRNKLMKATGFSAGLTAVFGITEPALYGVTLRLKKPFVCGCIGGALGSVVASLFGTYYYAYAGLPGLLTVVNAISPSNPASFMGELAGVGVAIVATFALVFIVGFEDPIDEELEAGKVSDDLKASDTPAPIVTASETRQLATLVSPLKGHIVPLSTVKDESFAQKLLGDGVAIIPSEGVVRAPCDAVISSVIDTKHAVGMTMANGAEVLIHVGLDTVQLKGEHFDCLVTLEQSVKVGDPLIHFDLEKITAAGYDVTTPCIVMNSDEFEFNLIDPNQEHQDIEVGQPVIQMA
ncbi:beta-glucoside-specific PTS transporter subunit IIABC [Vibrio palustris]|uniref:PTS system beta-glucoside-specific EIIBCA component n=1 Tax=Vibrio palustris TaxID=1918946 RepID=A0A1R4B7U0_9VIBR|nr:beta-glucoside-specific PTS transporter subunit IIABC [Vibrio palustris]SJL84985.1 PTS system beta-glucoside-specific EIIBCA component [Vibrio palustris]